MAQFEKLCAVSDGTIDECVQAFVSLVPALEAQYSPAHPKTEEELARWVPIIEILFALVRNTAKTGTADLAVDLGFGLAEVSVATGRSPLKTLSPRGTRTSHRCHFRSQSGRERSSLVQMKLKLRLRLARSARPGSGA